jgi:hypothetical protein
LSAHILENIQLPERYELVRHLASGGMASVWCAEDRVLGRRVAIKLLAPRLQHDPGAVARFGREARAAARLSAHPHVVTIYDVGESGGSAFIVMEHLAGGTVANALTHRSPDHAETLRWIREAAQALDYAHSRGVIHRDIKPANMLLDLNTVLHVADFGIARLATENTITSPGELLGTAAYLSPERALGEPANAAADRYSLGVVAFELLTGRRPFTAEHFAAQARQHIEDAPPRASSVRPSLPPALDPVLARGLAKRTERRWPSATAMADAIDDVMATHEWPAVPAAVVAGTPRAPAPVPTRGAVPAPTPATARIRVPPPGPPRRAVPPPQRIARPLGGRIRSRAGVLAALAGVALAAGTVVGAGSQSGGIPSASLSARTPTSGAAGTPASRRVATAAPRPRRRPPAAHHATTTATATQPAVAPPPPAPTQTPVTAGTPVSLEARGHQLMLGGAYGPAVAILREAVASAPKGDVTYAYALYDLGRSLRLSGDPQAAIPVLLARLQIPNQPDAVRRELLLAEAGAHGTPTGDGPGRGRHRAHPQRD